MMQFSPEDRIALAIWWALIWRMMIFSTLTGLALGLLMGVIGLVLHLPQNVTSLMGLPFTIALSVYVGMRIVRHLMTKGFGPYRLTVVPRV